MIDGIINLFTSYTFNSMLAVYIYWIPMVICTIVYFIRIIKLYKEDIRKRNDHLNWVETERSHYRPSYIPGLTLGKIAGFIFASICPVVNLYSLLFDCATSVFSTLVDLLDIPLVPKPKEKKDN